MSGSENPTGHFGSNLSWILSFSLYGITMGHPHYICIMGCIFIQSIAVGVCVPSISYWDWDVCLPFCVFANKHLSPECVTAAWIKTAPMQKFHMIHSISGRARATLTPQHIPLASFRSLTETIRDKSKKEKKNEQIHYMPAYGVRTPLSHCATWPLFRMAHASLSRSATIHFHHQSMSLVRTCPLHSIQWRKGFCHRCLVRIPFAMYIYIRISSPLRRPSPTRMVDCDDESAVCCVFDELRRKAQQSFTYYMLWHHRPFSQIRHRTESGPE